MNKDKFAERYFDFWIIFHPGQKMTDEVIESANVLYEKFNHTKVSYELIDEILTTIEADWKELPYSFNLFAYVGDWIRTYKLENLVSQETFDKKPIDLPSEKKFDPEQEALIKQKCEELEKKIGQILPNWLSIVRKINAKRLSGQDKYQNYRCWSCMDSGWMTVKPGFSATCTCDRGQRIRGKDGKKIHCGEKLVVREATIEECMAAAKNNGQPVGLFKQRELSSAPF
uniref:Uncharacterized protein n=1 Tax=viral metagenome TaxID=1070528 RepID=A0A6M3IYX6_9ZZZZ